MPVTAIYSPTFNDLLNSQFPPRRFPATQTSNYQTNPVPFSDTFASPRGARFSASPRRVNSPGLDPPLTPPLAQPPRRASLCRPSPVSAAGVFPYLLPERSRD